MFSTATHRWRRRRKLEEEEEWGRRRTCWGRHTLLEASALRTESTPLWRGGAYSQVRLRSMALCCLEPRYAFHSYDLYIYVCVCACEGVAPTVKWGFGAWRCATWSLGAPFTAMICIYLYIYIYIYIYLCVCVFLETKLKMENKHCFEKAQSTLKVQKCPKA